VGIFLVVAAIILGIEGVKAFAKYRALKNNKMPESAQA